MGNDYFFNLLMMLIIAGLSLYKRMWRSLPEVKSLFSVWWWILCFQIAQKGS
uniref:Uncharacterized protein n=1 Tax=Anguilla anguilla TaxID=7936 RepID=A0A0E9RTH4_ANGAN